MRNKIALFTTGCLVWLMFSCLGDSDNYETELARNCQISSFSLSHDSINGLSSVTFTIDQQGGRIFNMDSLPYGTEIDKVICDIEYMSSYAVSSIKVIQEAIGDTIAWNASDSLDFSKSVKFVVGAYDGVTTKTYTAWVNVHQMVPDSMVWDLYTDNWVNQSIAEQKVVEYEYKGNKSYFMYMKPASGDDVSYNLYYSDITDLKQWTSLTLNGLPAGKIRLSQMVCYEDILYVPSTDGLLYQSADGQNWSALENTPSIAYVLGDVKKGVKLPSALAVIINDGETLSFASMDKSGVWVKGDVVPEDFPLTGFGHENFTSMYYEYLIVLGGRDHNNQLLNSCWGTMNGYAWARLTGEDADYFDPREGAMLTSYDDKIWMIGGIDAKGNGLKDIYQTVDRGITWSLLDTLVVLPEEYVGRGFSSILVDDDQFISILGGKTSVTGNDRQEIWRGRINRFGFKK